jgi:bacillithiol biosynthesis cysteine-adding enzyme BshC
MASEDHDFDEINFFRLHGKKFKWEHQHGGAVGELDTDGIEKIVPLLRDELGPGAYSEDLVRLFEQAYTDHSNLADATRFLADSLFGKEGLVVVDGNDKVLKELFAPFAKQELLEKPTFKAVSASSERLEALGYSRQVNPREINLFYLHDEGRKRIVEEDGHYHVLDTNTKWQQPELIQELEDHPERFSPNALLRPLYQEVVLPNLCYIGGGGEMAYWLQLFDCFRSFKVEFPVLMLRNSVLLVTQKQWNKFERFGIGLETLFQDWHELSTAYVAEHSRIPIDFGPQRKYLKAQFKSLHELADQTDPSFRGAVAAQEKKQLNGLDKLEKRLVKAQKKKMSDGLERLSELKEALFPQESLQERGENFSAFYKDMGPGLIDVLLTSLDPLDQRFTILLID